MRRSDSILAPVAVALAVALARQGCIDDPPTPVPTPTPTPVDPTPTPIPVPVSAYRVLIVEETAARSLLKPEQLAILTSAPFRAWLGKQGAASRFVDQDVDQQFMDDKWRAMLKETRRSLPWIVVTGKGQYSGPLPGTVAETELLIGTYKP